MLAVMSPHTVGIFYLVAAILVTIGAVVSLLPLGAPLPWAGWLPALLFAALAFYFWPQAINALG